MLSSLGRSIVHDCDAQLFRCMAQRQAVRQSNTSLVAQGLLSGRCWRHMLQIPRVLGARGAQNRGDMGSTCLSDAALLHGDRTSLPKRGPLTSPLRRIRQHPRSQRRPGRQVGVPGVGKTWPNRDIKTYASAMRTSGGFSQRHAQRSKKDLLPHV